MLSNTVAEEKRLDKKGRFIAYQLDLFVTHFTFGGVRTIASSKCTGNFSDIFFLRPTLICLGKQFPL